MIGGDTVRLTNLKTAWDTRVGVMALHPYPTSRLRPA